MWEKGVVFVLFDVVDEVIYELLLWLVVLFVDVECDREVGGDGFVYCFVVVVIDYFFWELKSFWVLYF